jgi:uncharacterized protein (DUF2267 family)
MTVSTLVRTNEKTIDPERVTVAVFRLLSRHVSEGEIKDVQACLPEGFQALWS